LSCIRDNRAADKHGAFFHEIELPVLIGPDYSYIASGEHIADKFEIRRTGRPLRQRFQHLLSGSCNIRRVRPQLVQSLDRQRILTSDSCDFDPIEQTLPVPLLGETSLNLTIGE